MLDTVAAAIESLPVGGRGVGIVTHIPELTERPPSRITVEKRSPGSRVLAAVSRSRFLGDPGMTPVDVVTAPAPGSPAPPPPPPDPPVEVSLTVAPTLNFALEQSGTPFIRDVAIRNRGFDRIAGATLEIELAPGLGEAKRIPVPAIAPGETVELDVVDYRLPAGRLRQVVEAERARLSWTFRLATGEMPARGEVEVDVLAYNEWPGARGPIGLLAMFVVPNHPVVARVLKRVRDRLAAAGSDPALTGYQERSTARVRAIVAALYETVQSLGITYIGLPASFEKTGQKIRLPDVLLREELGNCLDLTTFFASCLEQLGLYPLLVVVDGHAFPAVWLRDERFPEGIVEDAARLRNLVALGDVLAFDSSTSIARPPVPLDRARAVADESLRDEKRFLFALDVRVLRGDRFRPLPIRTAGEEAAEAEAAGASKPATDEVRRILEEAAREPPPLEESERKPPPPPEAAHRFRQWQDRLLDLSLRNRLLNFSLRGRGALPLDVPDSARFEDLLAAGRALEVLGRPLVDANDRREESLVQARVDAGALREARLADLAKGVLHAPLSEAELWTRARHLALAARTDLEEGGACTLFAAIGILRWFEAADAEEERLAPLLLYPVDLEFDRKLRRVRIRKLEEEPVVNVTLIEKMRRDYAVELGPLAEVEPDESGLDIPWLLRTARSAIQRMPRWEVLDEAHVGQFTFTKFLMWKDLAENAEVLLRNDVVRHIAAARDQSFPAQVAEVPPERVDAEIAPADLPLVLDADATQVAAVASALRGRSFVLQGPPGTGKSQTITNLIAAALAAGKTVLFVSEKMAALEVVYRRLREAGLGDFCLELHSHKSNKKQVLESLGRVLERAERQGAVPWEERSRELAGLRARLNGYVEALHARHAAGITFYEATSRLRELAEAPELRFKADGIEKVPEAQLEARRDAVASFAPRAAAVEPAADHPFAACEVDGWSAKAEEELRDAIDEAGAALERLEAAAGECAAALGMAVSGSTEALEAMARLGLAIAEGPLPRDALERSDWAALAGRAAVYAKCRRENDGRREELLTRWSEAVFADAVAEDEARVARWAPSPAPIAWLMLLGARGRLRPVARGPLGSTRSVASDLAMARRVAKAARELGAESAAIAAALGIKSEGDLDPIDLDALVARVDAARKAAALLKSAVTMDFGRLATLADPGASPEPRTRLAGAARALDTAARALGDKEAALLRAASAKEGAPWPRRDDPEHRKSLRARLSLWRDRMGTLRAWCFYRQEAARVRGLGLGPVVDAHRAGTVAAGALEAAFERWFLGRWTTAVRDQEPALREFDGAAHHRTVDRFRACDIDHRALARRQAAAKLEEQLPRVGSNVSDSSEVGILLRELRKKTRHLAIRKLLAQLPNLLPRLKPCHLMSPLSVAQYLPADGRLFDLVVFDEASQIGTHDAIGAIARGRQVVVVGDSKQLPPTTFFARRIDDDEESPDDNDVVELESVLEEAVAKQLPQQMLGWHYRSRHESLIDFSNRHYYDGRLDVFPAARARVEELGVAWHPVTDGVYSSGSTGPDSRTNRREAERLVEYLAGALRRWKPGERTFGVVTFNMAQQELIQDLLDERRAADPEIEPHFGGLEPVFVKNLENVQGDERDEVLFSITYARDQNGRLRTAFGPLSTAGGERRLNVAITRARFQLRVFSTLRPEEIDLRRTAARGTAHLKAFLEHVAADGHAGDGATRAPAAASPRFASAFEREIHDAVAGLGHRAATQVGCGGYRVDVAVAHPDRQGEYVLGIECDGPSYRSAKAARDRDRLRGQVLESLGWRLHRIWSTDWWFDEEAEKRRLAGAIEAARKSPPPAPAPARPAAPDPAPSPVRSASTEPAAPGPTTAASRATTSASAPAGALNRAPAAPLSPALPYVPVQLAPVSDRPDDFYGPEARSMIRHRLATAVAEEGPIHVELLARRVLACWGWQKVTARARQRIEDELGSLVTERRARRVGDFAWPPSLDPARHDRFRAAAADGTVRDADQVPPEEVAVAVAWVLAQSFSIDAADLARDTARLLGYQRMGKQVAAAVAEGVALLKQRGRCVEEEGRVHWRG